MSKIITAITQWFRSLLWAIAEIFLFLLDCLWKVVLKIGSLDIGGSSITSKFFILMSACMLIFIVFKLLKIYVKFFVDNEYRENINLSKILISLSLASMLISGVPLIYKSACSMTSDAIAHVNYWIPSDFADEKKSAEDMNMSDVLIQSGRVNLSNRNKELSEEIKLDENFDINATKTEEDYKKELLDNISYLDDEGMTSENALSIVSGITGVMGWNSTVYKYFPTWSSIILEILLSIVALFIFAMTALQIAMRSVICSMKYLLAPYMVASIIDPEDKSFGTWVRSISGDLIANFCQIYFTYFVLMLCSNSAIQNTLGNDWIGIFSKIALFIGGLLAVQEIPNVIAQFFGSSGQSMMETFRQTMFMGSVLAEPKRGLSALKGGIQTGVDAGFKGAAKIGNGYNSLKGMKDTIQSADSIRDGLSDVGKFTMDSVKNKAANKMQQSGYKGYSSASPNRSNDFSRKFDKGKEGQSSNSDVNKRNNNEGSRTSQSNPFNDGTGMTMGMNGTSPLGSDLSAPSFDNIDFSDSSDFSYGSGMSSNISNGSTSGTNSTDFNPSNSSYGNSSSQSKIDPIYNQELDAAKYYGIENAKSMPREKLQKELENRGYRTQTVREKKPYTFKSAYQRNMERNRRRMKK
ncbi:hypothetical protein LI184_02515 [Erysipelatoclostridium ramosum]|uniref:hypothetical protein n=1 Tax=Thomasclavelia ramosa TaxID=1547 RepID=UPI001D09215D|nr:hypothetical protein [Thomasclavelia ramosa]MCB6555371.1 hypothetical protein [Thomasclavelia ramosa]